MVSLWHWEAKSIGRLTSSLPSMCESVLILQLLAVLYLRYFLSLTSDKQMNKQITKQANKEASKQSSKQATYGSHRCALETRHARAQQLGFRPFNLPACLHAAPRVKNKPCAHAAPLV
eukprot:365276-Chlamydomonas_euryale.AAC.20